ncbi:pepsin-like aspartic protease [endosymbiont GvMRE of Glomus versiforme]|uniref:pepsin-like aspartic protease n=1 Tax=endosymbiont GvMRE of Glomus versiforme TaxID=2039283 RepID=UPI000ECC1F1A|nr:pepsin-like aspartic protease [endosymbiont GvMRE of Glomus versiforme]RHZ35690.1 Aspartic-type endopeptidase ctsD [endosymbiont GvMRE of Glomus versiforme]
MSLFASVKFSSQSFVTNIPLIKNGYNVITTEKECKEKTDFYTKKPILRKLKILTNNEPEIIKLIGLSDEEYVDIFYMSPIKIGDQEFRVLLDTGSADFWVDSNKCESKACNKSRGFDETSKSFFNLGESIFTAYGSGESIVGMISGKDDVTIGNITAKNQTFGRAIIKTDDFFGPPIDGILGMSLNSLSKLKAPNVFSTLIEQNKFLEPIFSFYLRRSKSDKDNNFATLTLGGVDKEKFSGDIVNNKVIGESGFWVINLEDVLIDKNNLKIGKRKAIIDTGSTFIFTPFEDAKKIHEKIKDSINMGDGNFAIPCNTTSVVSLQFNGIVYDIDPRDLSTNSDSSIPKGFCASGILGTETISNSIAKTAEWLIGNVFLKNVYSVFNTKEKTVGFAPSVHDWWLNKQVFLNWITAQYYSKLLLILYDL